MPCVKKKSNCILIDFILDCLRQYLFVDTKITDSDETKELTQPEFGIRHRLIPEQSDDNFDYRLTHRISQK